MERERTCSMPFSGKEITMDSLAGMDTRLTKIEGYGDAQQEGYANIGESLAGDFFTDMQVLGYNPFEEGECRETHIDDAGQMETVESLPAGLAQAPDIFSGLEAGETLPEGETGQHYAERREMEKLEGHGEPERREKADECGELEKMDDREAQAEMEEPEGEDAEDPGEEAPYAIDGTEERSGAEEGTEEERKRAEHEASEAKRKAEWEARQQAKKEAAKAQLERIKAMSTEELVSESMKRVGADTEKLTRRNMKECVSEYIQTACMEDEEFARQVMLPQKNMVRCFQYINRKAYEYVQDEMKADGIQPGRDTPCYSADIPDGLCYHWAEEYFRTMDVKEDKEEEEEFVPKPYVGKTASGSKGKKSAKKSAAKKPATAKSAEKKPLEKKASERKPEKKPENRKPAGDGQMSFMGQMSFEDMLASVAKAG